jgi:hypothetical protein
MASFNEDDQVLHRIRVRLFPSNLPGSKKAWYARTANEAELTVEDVASAMMKRGAFTGNYYDLVKHVREFLDETAYQLCDGYAVNMGYFSIHPVVGGFFASEKEEPKGHPVRFRFRARKPLSDIARYIAIKAEPRTDFGNIDSFVDTDSGETNGRATPGGIFIVTGKKIKITGRRDSGLYFVSKSEPLLRFKVARNFATNTSTRVSSIIPALPAGEYRIEIKTQFTVGGIDLKEPRTITSRFSVKATD